MANGQGLAFAFLALNHIKPLMTRYPVSGKVIPHQKPKVQFVSTPLMKQLTLRQIMLTLTIIRM